MAGCDPPVPDPGQSPTRPRLRSTMQIVRRMAVCQRLSELSGVVLPLIRQGSIGERAQPKPGVGSKP